MAKAEKAKFIKAPQELRQKAVNFTTGLVLVGGGRRRR